MEFSYVQIGSQGLLWMKYEECPWFSALHPGLSLPGPQESFVLPQILATIFVDASADLRSRNDRQELQRHTPQCRRT